MDMHRKFTQWVLKRGATIDGIAAHEFPARGLGIIATENHEAGEVILKIPTEALRTEHTVSRALKKSLGKITVHGLLAADLALDDSATRAPWRAILPAQDVLTESMPLMWDREVQDLLPPASKTVLEKQKKKFDLDWSTTSQAYSQVPKDIYLYAWLIVNTRTFYYVKPGSKKPKMTDDCMALNPFADYFNHAEIGCAVEFGPDGYTVTTNRSYKKGEEIYISYGNHTNDFLLAQYGFILAHNKWDYVQLDHIIIPELTTQQKRYLEDAGYCGNYALSEGAVCHRTQVALRVLCLPPKSWRRFIAGEDDGEKDQAKVDGILSILLSQFERQALEILEIISKTTAGLCTQHLMLKHRWEQIHDCLTLAIQRLQGKPRPS